MHDDITTRTHEKFFKELKDNVKELKTLNTNITERVAVVEESVKTAHKRVDAIAKQTDAIIRLSVSVENMSARVGEILDSLTDHDKRIDDLEKRPGDTALKNWQIVVGGLLTGTIGYLINVILQ